MVVRVAVVRGTVTHRYDWSTLPTLLLPTAADLSTVHLSPFWVHNRIWDLCSRPSCHTACSPDHYADGRAGHLCAGHLCAHAHLCAHSAARRPGTHGRYDSVEKKQKKLGTCPFLLSASLSPSSPPSPSLFHGVFPGCPTTIVSYLRRHPSVCGGKGGVCGGGAGQWHRGLP